MLGLLGARESDTKPRCRSPCIGLIIASIARDSPRWGSTRISMSCIGQFQWSNHARIDVHVDMHEGPMRDGHHESGELCPSHFESRMLRGQGRNRWIEECRIFNDRGVWTPRTLSYCPIPPHHEITDLHLLRMSRCSLESVMYTMAMQILDYSQLHPPTCRCCATSLSAAPQP